MRRWMFTAGLGGAAALLALLVPDLHAALSPSPAPTRLPAPNPSPVEAAPTPSGPTGSLGFSARLDQGTLLAGSEEDRFLVITVKAPEPESGRRMPVDVAVVMDTSGSMSGWHKIDYARLAARELVDSLRPGDRFSLVTFSDRARVLLPSQTVGDKQSILDTIDRVQEGGGTNMHGGITTGLEQLRGGDEGYVRRLLLLSDGHANVGISDAASLSSLARQASIADVSTSTIGLGLDFNEDLLASMADAGGGSYHFVDQAPKLAEIFGEELDAMTRTVARDVTVRMDLPPGVSVVDTYGYSDTLDSEGWRVYLGDIYAGQERKIVVRLDHAPATKGTLSLADITLDYRDLDLELDIHRDLALDAPVTRNAARAQASLDHETAVKAARAQAADLAEQAARAFESNDRAKAKASLQRTSDVLRRASRELAAPELLDDESDYMVALPAYESAQPSSEEGLRAVKSQKEVSRGYAF
jgi:Ca-activated chloride channel family protein